MLLDIHLQGVGSETHWRQRVQRELDLKLASVRWLLKRVRVEMQSSESSTGTAYCCRIVAVIRGGHVRSVVVDGVEPHACLSGAAARLRRSIERAVRSGDLRQLAQGAG